jgi:hypothetical protein
VWARFNWKALQSFHQEISSIWSTASEPRGGCEGPAPWGWVKPRLGNDPVDHFRAEHAKLRTRALPNPLGIWH